MALTKKTDDEIESIVQTAIEEALSFIESEIEPERSKAQRYFNGECDVPYEKDRAKIIATKCRDAVKQVKPSLLRVFLGTSTIGEFIPRTQADVLPMQQATKYVEYVLEQCGGYQLLSGAFDDALVKKGGILKAFYEERETVEFDDYTGLTDDEFALVAQDDEVEVLEHTARTESVAVPGGEEIEITVHDVKTEKRGTEGETCVVAIPPEDFFVDSGARSLDDFYIAGDRTESTIGELIAMGYEYEKISHLADDVDDDDGEAEFARRGYDDDRETNVDEAMRPVTIYNAYMKMDIEGTGVPRLYSFTVAGTKKELLEYEPADMLPYAFFETDTLAHAFFADCMVDTLINDQDVATSLWRGMIDNMNLSNNPGMAADENGVTMDDLMNNEVGKIVRTTGTPGDKLMPLVVPFAAGQTIAAMEYYDQLLQDKTGISRASMGLDPDALQNTTATAVNAAVGASDQQIEAKARNLAEGGLTQLYKILYHLAIQHADAEELIQLDGNYVPVDPRSWQAKANVKVNVGLGRGGEMQRAVTLNQTLERQIGIWTQFGPENGLVTLTQLRNTLADLQQIGGIHNSERYFQPMDEQRELFLKMQAQQAAANQPPPPDPMQGIIAAEQIKAQAKMATDSQKQQSDERIAMMKEQRERFAMGMEDDLARDQMVQDLAIKVAEILGQYGTSVDVAAVTTAQNAPRETTPGSGGLV